MEKNKDLYNELETALAYGYEMTVRNIILVSYIKGIGTLLC